MPLLKKVNFKEDNQLINYISNLVEGNALHPNYYENVEQSKEMGVHLKGDRPTQILEDYRPNEPAAIRDYRLNIYEPITQSQGKKIVNVLAKIQQSSNYTIKYPEQNNVPEESNLEKYTTEDYPFFGSLEKWAFNIALQQDLVDSNSLVVVMPLQIPEDSVTYLKPYTFIYRSDQVIDYGLNYYTVLLDEKNRVEEVDLSIWLFITDNQVFKAKQIDPINLGKVEIEVLYEFDFGEVPAFFMKGDYREETIPFAYDSFVSGILPYFNKAVRMDSDLDAQYNQHLFLERVEMEIECDAGCSQDVDSGTRVTTRLVKDVEIKTACSRCSGSGYIVGRSPMGITTVRKDAFDGEGAEFPGVTYIQKPIDIIQLTEDKINSLISNGLSSINMDIINAVGANQSGVAKTIDRSELQSFMMKISDNLFDNILANSYKFISLWRYTVVNDATLPIINKPTNFNAMNEAMLVEEIKMMADAGLNTVQYEMDLIDRRYPNDIEKQLFNKNVLTLDPLSGRTEEEKSDIKLNGGVTQEQFIISSMIRSFLLDAIEQDPEFLTKTREVKLKKLNDLAKAQIVQPIEISNVNGN